VAREAAESGGQEIIDIADRDADVRLSDLGEQQARAFGRWVADQPPDRRPTVVVASPFVRTRETARLIVEEAGLRIPVDVDERLRDRELGVLDLLTKRGVLARFPEEAERRERIGKYYHRPPGGESWADLCLRLRAVLTDVARAYRDERVLLVTHEVPVHLVRHLVEGSSEQDVLASSREVEYANCALTAFERDGSGALELVTFNHTVPLEAEGAPRTEESNVPVAPR
jgi:broad specificity phosphatase PhoE